MFVAIIIFNFIAFKAYKTYKRLSVNQIVHIWSFTIVFQIAIVDIYLDIKYAGYWYYTKEVDWASLPASLMIVPPVNVVFLNWFPFGKSLFKKAFYIVCWVIPMLIYELLTLLPEPWGYFNYGWWNLGYSAVADPILLILLALYYKWICRIEQRAN